MECTVVLSLISLPKSPEWQNKVLTICRPSRSMPYGFLLVKNQLGSTKKDKCTAMQQLNPFDFRVRDGSALNVTPIPPISIEKQ
jgi:hypothetical protein